MGFFLILAYTGQMQGLKVLCGLVVCISTIVAAEGLKMRTIAQGNFSGVQAATQVVVTNAAQWQDLWKKHSAHRTPAEPAPEADFQKESILFVAAGQKRSGGHRVEITEVKEAEGKTEVLVQTRGPKPGGIQLQALTAPFHIVAVPKLTAPVKFRVEEGSSAAP